jgi:DNA polymerase I
MRRRFPARSARTLRNDLAGLELSRKLATIDANLDVGATPEDLTAGEPDVPRLRELYTRLELRLLLKSLESSGDAHRGAERGAGGRRHFAAGRDLGSAPPAAVQTRHYEKSRAARLDAWLAKIDAAPLVSFDTETDSLNYMRRASSACRSR